MPKHQRASFPTPLIVLTSLLILFIFFIISLPRLKTSLTNRQSAGLNQVIRVPEPNEAPSVKGLAIPNSVVDSAPGTNTKIRFFSLKAKDNTLSVNTIAVYEGDIVNIQFSAHDDDQYDFAIPALGLSQKARKDETKIVEFQAVSPGRFPFSCSKCQTEGTLVVVPKA